MIITFIGHRSLPNQDVLAEQVRTVVEFVMKGRCEKIQFYCGGYGAFDNLCADVCGNMKGMDCEVVLVTPYMTETQQKKINRFLEQHLYDSVIYPPLEHVPPRLAILKRNEWMMDAADLVIAYVIHSYGGAYQALEYARKKEKQIINLAELE